MISLDGFSVFLKNVENEVIPRGKWSQLMNVFSNADREKQTLGKKFARIHKIFLEVLCSFLQLQFKLVALEARYSYRVHAKICTENGKQGKGFSLQSMGSRDGAVVRALASHQCGPGSIPGPSVICGLSLLLVLYSVPRGFSPGTPVFPSRQKPILSNSNSILECTDISELLGAPWVNKLHLHLHIS